MTRCGQWDAKKSNRRKFFTPIRSFFFANNFFFNMQITDGMNLLICKCMQITALWHWIFWNVLRIDWNFAFVLFKLLRRQSNYCNLRSKYWMNQFRLKTLEIEHSKSYRLMYSFIGFDNKQQSYFKVKRHGFALWINIEKVADKMSEKCQLNVACHERALNHAPLAQTSPLVHSPGQ